MTAMRTRPASCARHWSTAPPMNFSYGTRCPDPLAAGSFASGDRLEEPGYFTSIFEPPSIWSSASASGTPMVTGAPLAIPSFQNW
jgi:hypothetical protein